MDISCETAYVSAQIVIDDLTGVFVRAPRSAREIIGAAPMATLGYVWPTAPAGDLRQ
jgi:hypothetical protein